MKKFAIIFILISIQIIHAQEIIFCEGYTTGGTPVGAKNDWVFKSKGTDLFVMIKGDFTNNNILFLFIDKFENGNYEPYNSKALAVDKSKNWIVYKVNLNSIGQYYFYLRNEDQIKIAENNLNVKSLEEYLSPQNYYQNANMVFCERVESNKPSVPLSKISVSKDGGFLFSYIKHDRPLRTSKLIAKIWLINKKDGTEEFIEEKKFKVTAEWDFTYFRYQFKLPGEYKVYVYNEKNEEIKNANITITD